MRHLYVLVCLMVAAAPALVSPPPVSGQETQEAQAESSRTYDPNTPDGEPGYNAGKDPDHPMKSPDDPGEAWNNPRRADGTPSIRQSVGDWEWGELVYGNTYPTKLTVTNKCDTPETAIITVNDLPYLDIAKQVRVPAKSSIEVEAKITTPPPPNIVLTGHETLPEGGLFEDIKDASVVIWHPWNPPHCMPKRETYNVTGHIHFPQDDPDAGGGGPQPQKILTADPCTVYWNTGQPPPGLEEDCTEKMRALAVHYRERILASLVKTAPAEWEWLPSAAEIRAMSTEEMLAFKARTESQIGGAT
jgi:hypothetical protein